MAQISDPKAKTTAPEKAGKAPVKAKDDAAADPAPAAPKKKPLSLKIGFFRDEPPGLRPLANPEQEAKRHTRLIKRVEIQGYLIIALILSYFLLIPLLQTPQQYYARRINQPPGTERRLVALSIPNLTQKAILSWATTAVTEIMTFNFANYDERISMFQDRFLPEAWVEYVKALMAQDVINKFRSFQLVLTAAPSNAPIIISQGPNDTTGQYEWVIQVPVILKYVTNNNKNSRKQQRVTLTLVRVSTLDNPYGIAIKVWTTK